MPIIKVTACGIFEYRVTLPDGRKAGTVSSGSSRLPLPAGAYILEAKEQRLPVELKEGQEVEINLQWQKKNCTMVRCIGIKTRARS